jgi:hypothetical protein
MEALMRGIFLATALYALSTAALAQPPAVGEQMRASVAIVCDTKEQVMDLYSGTKVDNGKGIAPVYLKYQQLKNKEGEPTCNMQPVLGPTVKSIEDLGDSHGYSGNTIHGWLVELAGENGVTGFALYGEETQPAKPEISI